MTKKEEVALLMEARTLEVDEINAVIKIIAEYKKAIKKHPAWPEDRVHQVAIVAEESGELVRAGLQELFEGGETKEVWKEAVQTGAMAMRLLAHL